VLDIATHVSASEGHDVGDYTAAIDRLADIGILPRAFAARFRPIAGFRNVVVHGYLEVDLHVVHTVLNVHLDDFVEYAGFVEAWLGGR